METETRIFAVNNFYTLKEKSWAGALQTLEQVEEKGKEKELLDLINGVLTDYENGLTDTQLNDFLWFDVNYIEENIGKLWEE